ncbi:MAG: hypothetical protein A2507_03745 [Candidatus Magasanikbacteria bacterium RIFOXYD12_FULL_33_17]|nr:MAG: hypothetical protein A2507_03745 [Candidatus Magasanikbacteria bacterium RIFOXYD12_FULL_33_17]
MQKTKKYLFFLSSIFILSIFFNLNIKETLAAEGFQTLNGFQEVYEASNGSKIYTYMSACTGIVEPPSLTKNPARDPKTASHLQAPRAIILPAGASTITDTFVYFHGVVFIDSEQTGKEKVATPTTNDLINLFKSQYFFDREIATLKTAGKQAVMFVPRLYQTTLQVNSASKLTANEFNCFYQEAQQKLATIPGISYNPAQTNLTVAGHSAGVNTVRFYSDKGLQANNILLFDGCYISSADSISWCPTIVSKNTANNYFIYYDKNSASTSKGIPATSNLNSSKTKIVATTGLGHFEVATNCIADYTDNKLCNGKGTVVTASTPPTTPANTAPSKPLAPGQKVKVAAIGSSSFWQGCFDSYGKGFIQELQKTLTNTHIFYCKDTTESGKGYTFFLNSWRTYVKGKGYNELLLYAGLNGLGCVKKTDGSFDCEDGLNKYKQNLDIIISEAKNEGIKIIIVGAQPFKGYSSWTEPAGNNIITNNQRLKNDPRIDAYIDVYSVVDKNNDKAIDDGLSSDHLHLNTPTGKKIVYDLLMQQVYSGTPTNVTPTATTKPLTDSEVANLIKQPTPEINIPGLNFSEPNASLVTTDASGNQWLSIPYLGEYIAAVYKYGIIIISVIAVFSIIISGVMLIGSGGNSDIVSQAKKRMMMSVIGIVVSTTSYTLLYVINPDLVNFRDLKILYVKGEDLATYDSGQRPYDGGLQTDGGGIASKDLKDPKHDSVFQKYESCIGVDWQVLKAIAFTESRYNESVVNKLGFTGLFQTKTEYCESVVKKYGLEKYCNNLKNPEVSTIVGSAFLKSSVDRINSICPNASIESKIYFMYLGHHSPAAGYKAMKKSCNYLDAKPIMIDYWNNDHICKPSNTKCYADSSGNPRTATAIATEADNGAKGVIKRALQLGVTNTSSSIDKNTCPLYNHSLITF